MGYTHYWRRQEKIEPETYLKIVSDFKRTMPELNKYIDLADYSGVNEPILTNERVGFNGREKCGHPQNSAICIPWPSKNAGGVAVPYQEEVKLGQWFAGAEIEKRCCNGDCSYESFTFDRIENIPDYQRKDKPNKEDLTPSGERLFFNFCKTAFRPYDLAVITFLIIAKHYLSDNIKVSSDGEDCHWFDGKMLCQVVLGYGLEYVVDDKGLHKT